MKLISQILLKTGISIFLLLWAVTGLRAQNPAYLCELRNDTQVDATTFEFDIYLLRTGSTVFEYSSMQFGININAGVRNGGTISVSLVGGSSQLTASQIPSPAKFSFDATKNCIIMTGTPGPGPGSGTIISNTGNGTRVGRIRLSNTVNFGSVTPDLTWSFLLANGYATKVNAYVGVLSTDITVQSSHTTSNLLNLALNPIPTAFTVTGTGSYCQGSGGLTVGLTDSENGVTYTLLKNGSASSTLPGTGSPINFTNQLFGTYTVSGTNGGGTTLMNGNAVLTENATPVAPTVGVVNNCNGTSTLTASGFTGTLLWSTSATTASITVNSAGNYTVTQTVSGCTSLPGSGTAAPKTTPVAPTVGVVNNCNGTSTLTASGFTGTLLWSTSATTASITVNSAGTYTVTQTVNGCTSSAGSGTAAPKTTPVAPGVSVVDNCGTSTLTATGFTGTLLWSTSATTVSITVNTSGTYTVTQTVNGCTSLSGSGIAAPKSTPPAPTVAVVDNCNGTSTLTASGFTGTLLWSTSATTASITVNAAGTYTVTQTVSGCSSLAGSGTAAPKTTPAAPTVTVVDNCNGTSTLTASAYTGTLLWSTSATTASIIVNAAGTYTVTQTVSGCTSLAGSGTAAPKTAPAAPTVVLTQPTCLVGTGTITITAPTGSGMTYSIDGSTYTNTTGIFTLVSPNTYVVTARSAAGCISLGASVTINAQPPAPVVNNQSASILSGGTFTITPSGVTIPVGTTYTWTAPIYTNGVTGGSAQPSPQLSISGILTIPSGAGTATYTVTPTFGTCIGATFTVTVTVTSTCVGVTIGTQPADISMCAGSGIATFTVAANGTAPFTYQWQYNSGSWVNVVNGTPAGATYTNSTTTTMGVTGIISAGSYQYRCFITNCTGGNNATSGIATLTVNASPIPTLTSSDLDNVFCFGTSVVFTAGGGTNFNFRVNGTTVQNGASTTYTTTSLANGQIVTVVVTNATGCTATSAPIQNIVNPLPFIILSTSATCSADFTTYSVGVTVGSGTVTSPLGTVTNNGGNIWTISGIPAHTNVSIKVTDSGGCENTLIVTAPVDCTCPVVLPPVSGGNRSYCAGGIIPALTATVLAGETIDWYDSSSGGNILLPGSLSYTPSAAGTYYALGRKIAASSCVSSTRTPVILTMNPLPIPTLTSSDADNIFCGGTSVIFTAGGGTSYNFLVGGLSVQNGVSATYTTSTLTNGQSVVVIVTNASACSATSAAITNTVNPTPVPTLTSSDADNSFCAGTNVTFTAGGGTNYNFRVGGVSVQNGVLTTYSTNSLTNGQVVDVVVSNTGGCSATSAAITNSIFAAPIANAGTGGNNCGLGFHLNGSLNIGIGTWSKVSGPGSVSFSPDANTPTALATVTSYGTYIFSWTVANGTCSSSANVTVVFIQQPPANGGPGGDECDKNFIMNAVITAGVGTWTKINGPGNAVFTPDNHLVNTKVTVDQFGTYNFGWTVVNSTCTSSDVVRVVFHDLPPVNAGRDTAFCKGGSMQLHAQGVGTVSWIPVTLVSNPNIINPVATPDTTTTFTVNLTDQFGCKNSDNIVVEVRVKPIANAGPDQELTYVLKTTMDATLAHNYETGVWSVIPKSATGVFLDSTNSKTQVSKLSLGKNKFLWTVNNGYCHPASTDTVLITVNDFIIPTLITPNMDGRNDYFVLRGLATLGKTELIIFDRRGTQVYRNINYDNSWNGVDYNKNPLPSDTYFYVIKSENGISISGYIVIRR